MRQKNYRVGILKAWIVNTIPGARERLIKEHQSLKKDQADFRKEERTWY
jgi:hypothetical protein|tara:strand:+ start:1389 stop:1535 length:147 start_codon:yes stop_codon:yes gene_type:complete